MLLKIKTLFSKKNIKKLLRSSLCLILCLMTVICFGGVLAPVQANAVAGVDDAIFFIVAFLICCGMTFSTTSAATNAAQQFYAKAPPSVQEIIDYQAEQLQKDTALPLGIVEVLKSDWKALIDEFMAQFPQYCNIDVDYTNLLNQQLTDGMSFYQTLISDPNKVVSFDVPWYDDSFVTTQLSSSATLTFCTTLNCSRVVGETLNNYFSTYFPEYNLSCADHLAVFSVPSLNLSSYFIIGRSQLNTSYMTQRFYPSVDCPGYLEWDGHLLGPSLLTFFYKNELCTLTSTAKGLIISTASYANIVADMLSDDVILPNDNLINCDDLTIRSVDLMKLLYGEDVFGVGVDAAHIPGIDSFPSTADDLTDVSTYPDTIPISVPQDLTDTISKTAEDIRTVDKDKTDTKDDTKEDPDTKPNKPSIPGLSLPEILFKEKFPFCLPWDLYNLFAGLQTEEEAPRFVVPFKFERLGIDEEIVIDFSDYEEQIKIIRFFTGAMFVLALIMISRKLIGAQ
ncbi:hypothetical protein [Ruminococcus sp.]|uniref:hypothetical protein n=1 Tax=Ruminococcus sp. TaxID=41978 RepID=UPI003AF63CD1